MQINAADTNESFGLTHNDGRDAGTDLLDTQVRGVHVLEAIEQSDELRDRPVQVLCPNCGEEVERYEDGLPSYLSWFKSRCSDCEVELRRWSAVAVDAAYTEMVTPSELAELVQSYWDRHLWDGIQTAENCPRTREFTEAYSKRAQQYGWEWSPTCPLCRRTLDELGISWLDYHHWQKEPDVGICLCRSCHDDINGGDCDTNVDWQARKLGLKNKHDLQILRLAAREHLAEPAASLDSFAARLVERYNLIQTPEAVRTIIDQARESDEVQSVIDHELPDCSTR